MSVCVGGGGGGGGGGEGGGREHNPYGSRLRLSNIVNLVTESKRLIQPQDNGYRKTRTTDGVTNLSLHSVPSRSKNVFLSLIMNQDFTVTSLLWSIYEPGSYKRILPLKKEVCEEPDLFIVKPVGYPVP